MQINKTYYEDLSTQRIDQILDELKAQASGATRTIQSRDDGQEGVPA
jgi:hypothetical protein